MNLSEIFGYACLILADKKTLERPVSERIHKKLEEIVTSGDEETVKLLDRFLDLMIHQIQRDSPHKPS